MTDPSYCKADLLWEATRSNEDYKSFYKEAAGPINEEKSKWERIWHPGTYRWKIHGLLHPSINIDEIHLKIKGGADPNEVHPYYYLFESERKAIIQHQVPKIESDYQNDQTDSAKIDSTAYKWYQGLRTMTKDRILLSINPMATDKVIFEEIKKIKKSKRRILKHELETLKVKDKRSYYPRDIDKYIGWLKKYTEIVEYLQKKNGIEKLTIKNGVITLPEDFSYLEIVPNDTLGKYFAGQQKAYKTAYMESIRLIRSSPDISFKPHKTQQ